MPDRISVRDRVQAIDQLNQAAFWLNDVSVWLGSRGAETEADMAETAARNLAAACWLLSRPLRAEPPPDRWQSAGTGHPVPYQQGTDQQR
jgi:hypothetical protein